MYGPRSSPAAWASRAAPRPWSPLLLPGLIGWQPPTLASAVTDGAAVTSLQLAGPSGTTPTLTGSGSVTWDAHTGDMLFASGATAATLVLPNGGTSLDRSTGGAQSATQDTWALELAFHRNVSQFANGGARIGAVVSDDEQMIVQGFDGSTGFLQLLGGGFGNTTPLDPFNDRTAKGAYHLAMAILVGGTKYIVVDGEIRDRITGQTVAYPTAAAGGPWGFGGGFGGSAARNMVTAAWGVGTLDPTTLHSPRWLWERWIAQTFPQMALPDDVTFFGDSQTAGVNDGGNSGFNAYPNNPPALVLSRGKLSRTWTVFGNGTGTLFAHAATSGWTTTDLMTSDPAFAARFPARYVQFGAWRVSGLRRRNVHSYWIGTNDFFGSGGVRLHDAPTTHANLKTMCLASRAAGALVIVTTCLPRTQTGTPTTYATDRAAYNAQIRAEWPTYADALVDVDTHPELADPTNTAFYENGLPGVHLNDKGADIMADDYAAALNGL